MGIGKNRRIRRRLAKKTTVVRPPKFIEQIMGRRSEADGRIRVKGHPRFLVVKGCRGTQNIINLPRRQSYFAFVSTFDDCPDGSRIFTFECVDTEWMGRVWTELLATSQLAILLPILSSADFDRGFLDSFRKLARPQRQYLYELYLWFLDRTLRASDPAPVAFFEWTLPANHPRRDYYEENDWYHLVLEQGGPSWFGEPPGVLSTIGLSPDDDGPREQWWPSVPPIRVYNQIGPTSELFIVQQGLKMLHFPKSPPPPAPPLVRHPPPRHASRATPMEIPGYGFERRGGSPSQWWTRVTTAIGRGIDQVGRALDALVPDLGVLPGLVPAAAGPGLPSPAVPSLPGRRSGPQGRLRPLQYVGGDGGAAVAGQAQPVNPMVRGAGPPHNHQPFVGVIDIGQGNCNVLFDREGKAKVYYDFGYRKNGDHPPRGAAQVCLCHNPLIVLSHWDGDHVLLCRYNPRSYALTWIAPQQHMGSVDTREVVARVLAGGGTFHLWEPTGGVMAFNWGFLVRAGAAIAGQRWESEGKNNTGLAIYVCVKDNAGATTCGPSGALTAVAGMLNPAGNALALAAIAGRMRDGAGVNAHPSAAAINTDVQNAVALATQRDAVRATVNAGHAAGHRGVVLAVLGGISAYFRAYGIGPMPADATLMRAAAAAVLAEQRAAGDLELAVVAATAAIDPAVLAATIPDLVTATQRAVADIRANLPQATATGNVAGLGLGGLNTLGAAASVVAPAARVHAGRAAALVPHNSTHAAAGFATNNTLVAIDLVDAAAFYAPLTTAATPAQAATRIGDRIPGDRIPELLRDIVAMAGVALAAPAPVVPGIQPSAAAHHWNDHERFVFSTGDAMVQFVPPQTLAARPVVAGMVACHHGSNQASGFTMDTRYFPWAARSARSGAMGGPQGARPASLAAEAVVGAGGGAPAHVQIARSVEDELAAGSSAAVASLLIAAGRHGHIVSPANADAIATAAIAALHGTTAAAVLVTAGVAPTLATTALANAALAMMHTAAVIAPPGGGDIAAAAQAAVQMVIPAVGKAEQNDLTPNEGHLRLSLTALFAALPLAPQPNQLRAAFFAASGNAAAVPAQQAFGIAAHAAIVAHAAAQLPAPASETQVAERSAEIGAAAALAARAAGLATPLTNLTYVGTIAALGGVDTVGAAQRASGGGAGSLGPIAYPYGANNSFHHPSPRAITKYEAHGFSGRLNTGAADNDVALGWEVAVGPAYEGPLRGDALTPGVVDRTARCPCPGIKSFHC